MGQSQEPSPKSYFKSLCWTSSQALARLSSMYIRKRMRSPQARLLVSCFRRLGLDLPLKPAEGGRAVLAGGDASLVEAKQPAWSPCASSRGAQVSRPPRGQGHMEKALIPVRGVGEVPSRVLLGLELPPLKLGTRDTEQLCLGRHNSSNETHFSSRHPAQATPRQWGEWAKGEQPGEGLGK